MVKYKRHSPIHSLDRKEILSIYNSKAKKEDKLTREELNLIVKEIFKEISFNIVESVGGVIVKGLGYFCNWMSPMKMRRKELSRGQKTIQANYHTDGFIYHPTLLTDIYSDSFLDDWSMDRSFNRVVNRGISRKLISGFKYKMYYSTIKMAFNNNTNKDGV